MCIYTYIYIYIHIHIHTCICTYIYIRFPSQRERVTGSPQFKARVADNMYQGTCRRALAQTPQLMKAAPLEEEGATKPAADECQKHVFARLSIRNVLYAGGPPPWQGSQAGRIYYTILYYTILYYTILCYAILYYTTNIRYDIPQHTITA